MKLYLAIGSGTPYDMLARASPPYILESFLSIRYDTMRYAVSPGCKGFMLDSGAFTFMTSKKGKPIDWEAYVIKYADFIKSNDIKYFYEVDVDTVIGVGPTRKLRNQLEDLVGRQCIPVWHRCRGKQAFHHMVDEYDYVSLGGIASREIKPREHPMLRWFVDYAHKNATQIHGLGGAKFYDKKWFIPFDSVDASSWSGCIRWGSWIKSGKRPQFNGSSLDYGEGTDGTIKWTGGDEGERREICLSEWSKYARYLDRL